MKHARDNQLTHPTAMQYAADTANAATGAAKDTANAASQYASDTAQYAADTANAAAEKAMKVLSGSTYRQERNCPVAAEACDNPHPVVICKERCHKKSLRRVLRPSGLY